MKLSSIVTALVLPVLLAGCDSLANPMNWFHSNHDGRVYNPQTGVWEYPAGSATPAPQRSVAGAGAAAAAGSQQTSDGRMFDPQKHEWVELHNAGSSPGSDAASTPSSPAASSPSAPPPPAPAPAPRPQRDTGVYNPTTGKIEWQSSGSGVTPSYGAVVKPTPKPKPEKVKVKHWWWPF